MVVFYFRVCVNNKAKIDALNKIIQVQREQLETIRPEPAPKKVEEKPDSTYERAMYSVYKGRRLKYHYDDVKLYIVPGQEPKFTELDPGDDLELVQEPDNTYDSEAVYLKTTPAARAGSVKVGYLRKGKLQDMTNDYLNASLPVLAIIASVDDDTGEVKIFLGFYRDSDFDDCEHDGEEDFDDEKVLESM